MEIPNKLKKEIDAYCKANEITDIDKFILKILVQGFNIEKYGLKPIVEPAKKPIPVKKPIPEEKPITEEKPKTKRVTKKTEKDEPIEKNKDLYDED